MLINWRGPAAPFESRCGFIRPRTGWRAAPTATKCSADTESRQGRGLRSHPGACTNSPAVWSDPDRFDPRRFDLQPGQLPGGHRYAWFPFGAGPRACIGMQIATLEVQIVIATILQAFTITTPLAATPVHAAITLQPTGALSIQLSDR